MVWFWLSLTVALLVIEISTTQLVSVWFALGAGVTALIKAIFPTLGTIWQVIIFVCVSIALLLSTRRFVKRFLFNRSREHETNLELNIGKEAVVVEEIDNVNGAGAVKINGLVWSARSIDDSEIPVDTIVIFEKIDGNKAIVKKKEA